MDNPVVKELSDAVVTGKFVDFKNERYYTIRHVDKMAPFFITLVSDHDHWLFASSNGGLTAGRISPETALFPYVTVDKIHDSPVHTGCKTLLRVAINSTSLEWEPFNQEHDGRFHIERHIYKNIAGNKLFYEEVNHDLEMVFRYGWMTSREYGFIRHCEIENLGHSVTPVSMVDGLQNILPANTPRYVQTNSSNLVDAYKWSELDESSGLAMFALFSGISDRAEPCESLKANSVFCLGLEDGRVLLSSEQLDNFRLDQQLSSESQKRGIRGAYLVNIDFELMPLATKSWQMVANIEQSQDQIVALTIQLKNRDQLADTITASVSNGTRKLLSLMVSADGFQSTAEENVSVHHYANVLFNVLRGGTFFNHYFVDTADFIRTVKMFNKNVFVSQQTFLQKLPSSLLISELQSKIESLQDHQLLRLTNEYLPITFGRRHGDPSRPWNQFAIHLEDGQGQPLLTYQGNWRDIFQNWEALSLSYPEFIESVIAKFVNASTMDGYNPYRITKEGIDWEVEDPEDAWSYIGYWGDHQIIYLLKLLELSRQFHPGRLASLLRLPVFSYANVPYFIKPFDEILKNAKSTVDFDQPMADLIEQRVTEIGADGKLVLDDKGVVYQVNLMEKMLVPLLSKLGNLVLGGGIWMNTQRPEWNDANNALVGQGLSMVTLCYLRRYIQFFRDIVDAEQGEVLLTRQVAKWIADTVLALSENGQLITQQPLTDSDRFAAQQLLGQAASCYRQSVYRCTSFESKAVSINTIQSLLRKSLELADVSIRLNQREDGLYHAYNLLGYAHKAMSIDHLYPMLEGQVAVLSSGTLNPLQSVKVIDALFDSDIYRADQQTFMLYPDRNPPGFLQKNRLPGDRVEANPLLQKMLEDDDHSIIVEDANGQYRFNAELVNAAVLSARLQQLTTDYDSLINKSRADLLELYEIVFNHQAFTGRSGGMFGFEGLGCVYWHMVSKLLLAVQESYFCALDHQAETTVLQQLAECYYKVRQGIGFNKTPQQYGAFPTDPYSHTPKHAGAQQPGMTGQVKEEILTRFGELGIRVNKGQVRFQPTLLRIQEFFTEPAKYQFLDVHQRWQEIQIPVGGLAFSWCQVPFIYQLTDQQSGSITVQRKDGSSQQIDGLMMSENISDELFQRAGTITQVNLLIPQSQLYASQQNGDANAE